MNDRGENGALTPRHGPRRSSAASTPAARARGRRAALLGGLLAAALAAGCRGLPAAYAPTPEPVERVSTARPDVPDWAFEPVTWDKVARIERWLATDGGASTGFWRLEAELQLAEGRLELSRTELVAGTADPQALAVRSGAAQDGLRRVLAHPEATTLQRRRARTGLETAERLAGVPARGADRAGFERLVQRAAWGARPARPTRMTRVDDRWTRITVHHSAEASAPPLDGSLRASVDAVRRIQHVHMNGSNTGYGDIGYHFLIDPAGRVFEGRALLYQGAHAYGSNNRRNVGVCLLGNFEERAPSAAALRSLEGLVAGLRSRYGIARSRVYGHQEFKSTLCPGQHLMAWLERYRGATEGTALRRTASARRAAPR